MRVENKGMRAGPPFALVVVATSLLITQTGLAQNSPSQVYQEQMRVLLDKQSPTQADLTLNGGGWFNFGFFDYDDPVAAKELTLRQSQLRGWASINKQDTHAFYVRGLYTYDDWNSNTHPLGKRRIRLRAQLRRGPAILLPCFFDRNDNVRFFQTQLSAQAEKELLYLV